MQALEVILLIFPTSILILTSNGWNPWDVIQFSSNAKIHLDSFLSVFNISGLPEEYYHNSQLASDGESFVDGAVIAAARTLPTWSDGDVPPIPSTERKAAKELQEECQRLLAEFLTTSEQDQQILGNFAQTYSLTILHRLSEDIVAIA
ncbi:plastid transcriptionally active 14 [Actinidia rufa]|uniref:Plastid transcriptionally active 14 n=1 Tax=Actinidia rufa TaxID=165716 RepID=A0A7J0DXC0_9ERIC|nr:plastid transcriptionally active 14 [Actinidia rufa]